MKKIFIILPIVAIALIGLIVFVGNGPEKTTGTPPADTRALPSAQNNVSNTRPPTDNAVRTEPGRSDTELQAAQAVDEHVRQWEQTKNVQFLNVALNAVSDPDNESALHAWTRVLESRPEALLEAATASSTNKEDSVASARVVIEWYVYLSGRFDSLPEAARQGILRISQQLELR